MSSSAGSGYIFHRNREQPAPDPNAGPLQQIKFYLDRYKIKEALRIFFHEDTLRLLKDEPDFMWDVIPLICRRLRGLCQYRFRVFEGCERMLCRIAVDENCNPKEVLISLLAEISHCPPSPRSSPDNDQQPNLGDDDNVFRAMIRPLEGTLLRMNDPTPRGENYRWVLRVLIRHIDNIQLPRDNNLDGKKRLSTPNDLSTKRFIEVLPLVLSFIEDFSDLKPLGGSDYDMKSPMPILTKSQIDEVLNDELAIYDVSDEDDEQNGSLVTGDKSIDVKADEVDFDFVTKPQKITKFAGLTTISKTNDTTVEADEQIPEDVQDNKDDKQENYLIGDADDDDLVDLFDEQTPSRGDIVDASITALTSLVQRPLSSLDLTSYCPDLRLCASRCLNILLEQVPNLYAPIYKRINSELLYSLKYSYDPSATPESYSCTIQGEEANLRHSSHQETSTRQHHSASALTLATCSYIYRCERAQNCPFSLDHSFPQILTHESLLFCHSPYIIALLERSEALTHEKGLSLLGSIISQIEPDTLTHRYLSLFEQSSLFRNLFQIMVYSQMCTNRRRAYDLFTNLFNLLTYDCKIVGFKRILSQTDIRPCIRAACIDQYRKYLTTVQRELINLQYSNTEIEKDPETMRRINLWQKRYKWMSGETLVDFLDLCVHSCLPDLIENYEILLATLTMFRYLRLRKVIIEDEIEEKYLDPKKIRKILFDPVRIELEATISHLRTEQDVVDCLDLVMCRLDLVKSVLVRTSDLYNC